MKWFKESILFVSSLISFGVLHAEEKKPPSVIPWYSQDMLESPFTIKQEFVDTTITSFQLYDFFSSESALIAGKGNIGHPSRLLKFTPGYDKPFPLFLSDPYQNYRIKHQNIRFYRPEHVFSDLFYVTGANREQLFYGMHSQRFQDKLYVTGKYRIINSPGEYSRMGTRHSNVYLSVDYRDPSERYQLLGSFIVNRFETQESGGLKDHISFEENPVRDSVFMYNALSRYRETAIHLNHFYRTGFYISEPEPVADVSESDSQDASADTDTIAAVPKASNKRFVNLGRINHHFSYQRRSFVFQEDQPPANFYQNYAFESSSTYDSTFVHTIENQVSWSNFPMEQEGPGFPFNFRVSLAHRFVSIQQPVFGNGNDANEGDEGSGQYPLSALRFNQLVPGISVDSDKSRFLSFDGFTRLTVGGYNDEDLDIGGSIYLGRADQESRLQASVLVSLREAPYFASNFSSNYVRWDMDFEKMNVFKLSTNFTHKKLALYGNYYLLQNAVFMNSEAFPEQNTTGFSVITGGINTQLGFGVFKSRHNMMVQYTGSQQFERLPPLVGYHSIYADFSLFKEALFTQVGFDVLYNSPYKPMAYMPMIMHFYSQDVYESHFDVYLDVFLTAKIKRTRFFLKVQNIMGLIANTPATYPVPFYPLPEAAFKFGVSWMFFD